MARNKLNDEEMSCRDQDLEQVLKKYPALDDITVRMHPDPYYGQRPSNSLREYLLPTEHSNRVYEIIPATEANKTLLAQASRDVGDVYNGLLEETRQPLHEAKKQPSSEIQDNSRNTAFSCLGVTFQIPAFLANLLNGNPR
jgi:hypothetical protein